MAANEILISDNGKPDRLLPERAVLTNGNSREVVRMVLLEPAEGESTDSGAHDTLEWLKAIRQHPIPPILLGLLAAGCGYLTVLQTPVYRARSTMEFQSVSDSLLSIKIGDFNPAGDPGGGGEGYLQTQVGILQSRSLRKRVLAKFEPYNGSPPKSRVRSAIGVLGITMAGTGKAGTAAPLRSLQVRNVPGTRLIEIITESEDPQFASAFNNAYSQEYIEQLLDVRGSATQRTADWLRKQLEEQQAKLQKTEDRMQGYARAAGIVFSDENQTNDQAKLKELQDALARAIVERADKQSTSELAETGRVDPVTNGTENTSIAEISAKITELRRELAELTTTYSMAHYKVKRVTAQINELENAMETQKQRILQRILAEYKTAQRREGLLTTEIQRQLVVVSDRAQKSVYYNLLKHEVEINRAIYDTLLHKLKEAGIASAIQASTVRVVDPADVPRTPYAPEPLKNALVGLSAGLLLGTVLVLFKDHSDTSFRGPGDTSQHLSIPELGVIPNAAVGTRKQIRTLGLGETPEPLALTTWSDRSSMLAESFRATLASVLFCNRNGSGCGVLTLTSAAPGEGKTTITSNLAIALAETSKRVLVIDADMRSPKLHDFFEVSNSWGLSDILSENSNLATVPIESLARPTKIPGVFLLPSGPATASIWQLLHSNRLPALIERLRGEFGAVLIDTPPMMHCPDGRVIARHCDAVILVVRARSTCREVVQACCQRFSEDGTQVLGAILNDWQPSDKRSQYYESYYHSYHPVTPRT